MLHFWHFTIDLHLHCCRLHLWQSPIIGQCPIVSVIISTDGNGVAVAILFFTAIWFSIDSPLGRPLFGEVSLLALIREFATFALNPKESSCSDFGTPRLWASRLYSSQLLTVTISRK